jgi:WhiB family redox-sensing transcriptional regulator
MESKALEQANCIGEDPELFFPEGGNVRLVVQTAKNICCECPIIKDCLQEALANSEEFGIWGGATPPERISMRRDPELLTIHLNMMKKRSESGRKPSSDVK